MPFSIMPKNTLGSANFEVRIGSLPRGQRKRIRQHYRQRNVRIASTAGRPQMNDAASFVSRHKPTHADREPALSAVLTVGGDLILFASMCPCLLDALVGAIPQEALPSVGEDGSWLIRRDWADQAIALLREIWPDTLVYGPGESPAARARHHNALRLMTRRDAR